MQQVPPAAAVLMESIRAAGARRHARWDDQVFASYCQQHGSRLWEALAGEGAATQAGSVTSYLTVVAAGIGAGYLAQEGDAPPSLLQGLLGLAVAWLTRSGPAHHAQIMTSLWNLADGARREAQWMEQYLLARLADFHDPLRLQEQAAQLLRPALEPQPDARWQEPYRVETIHLAQGLPSFLPGRISMLTPSLVRIGDRRHDTAAGVLLTAAAAPGAPQAAACIGRMPGTHEEYPAPSAAVTVRWGRDHVQVGDTRVPLPLMACEPLHTLALASGHLLAVVANSQRLWLVQPG